MSRAQEIAAKITHTVTLEYLRRIGMRLSECKECGFVRLHRGRLACSHTDHQRGYAVYLKKRNRRVAA